MKKDHTLLGQGIPLKGGYHIKPIWLPDKYRKGHMLGFGSTGIGKSRFMENLILQDILKGINVVFIDPKGDVELFEKMVQTAFGCNREDDLMLINSIFPECSAKVNPLAYGYTAEELVSHVISGIEVSDKFYIDVAYEAALAVVIAMIELGEFDPGNSPHINLNEIKKRCSHVEIQNLRAKLDNLPPSEKLSDTKESLDRIIELPQEYFSKVTSSLRTVLTAITIGSVGEIVGKATHNRFIERMEKGKGAIVAVQTGSMLTRKTSHIVGRVIISMIQSFVGRKFARGNKINPPLSVYIDEFGRFAYRDVVDFFAQAGAAGTWIHAFTQSIADLSETIGEDAARQIMDLTNNKIYMRVNDNSTAEYIETYSGKDETFGAVMSLGGHMMIRSMEKPIIEQNEMLNLPNRTFYYFGLAGSFKGRPEFVRPSFINLEYPEVRTIT